MHGRPRRWLVGSAVAAVAAALLVAPGAAAQSRDGAWPAPADAAVVSDSNHVVHYSAAGVGAGTANAALAVLAQARERFAALGFRPPPTDAGRGGDDRYDLYLCAAATVCFGRSIAGGAVSEPPDPTRPSAPAPGFGFLFLADAASPGQTVAHEYFHAWQAGYLGTFSAGGPWWAEATAEWAAHDLVPGVTRGFSTAPDNLICQMILPDPLVDPCTQVGYGFNPFVFHLVARYGVAFLPDTFAEQARLAAATPGQGHARAALENMLAARGSSLAAEFVAYSRASVFGGLGDIPFGRPIYVPDRAADDATPVSIGPWGIRTRLKANQSVRPNVTPGRLGIDLQGLDPALDGVVSAGQPVAIPPSGALRLLLAPNTIMYVSFTSPSDAPRAPAFRATRRAPVMSMRAGGRPRRRGATAVRVACPLAVGGCRARLDLRLGSGEGAVTRRGPVVALADGASRVVTIALGTRLVRRLRGKRRARFRVEQVQARPEYPASVVAQRALTLAVR